MPQAGMGRAVGAPMHMIRTTCVARRTRHTLFSDSPMRDFHAELYPPSRVCGHAPGQTHTYASLYSTPYFSKNIRNSS